MNLSNNLVEFGVDVDRYVREFPTWEGDTEGNLAFDMTVHLNYGTARNYHPYSDLDGAFRHSDRGVFEDFELFEPDVEVPEVGVPDGDMVSVNIEDQLDELQMVQSEVELLDYASDLAWAHNYRSHCKSVHT